MRSWYCSVHNARVMGPWKLAPMAQKKKKKLERLEGVPQRRPPHRGRCGRCKEHEKLLALSRASPKRNLCSQRTGLSRWGYPGPLESTRCHRKCDTSVEMPHLVFALLGLARFTPPPHLENGKVYSVPLCANCI